MPKIAATLPLCKFPLFEQTLRHLIDLSNAIFIRFDVLNGDPSILQAAKTICGDKIKGITLVNGWRHPDWREECLRMVDQYEPDMVIALDEDEMFDEGIKEEIQQFWFSDKKGMMFTYHPLVTCDGRKANDGVPYPNVPHMKIYKWQKGLSFFPYHGIGIVSQYCSRQSHWFAKTKINHYSCYTQKMEQNKHWKSHSVKHKGVKAVTMLGFGMTAKTNMEAIGEIWSLNNCYEVLNPRAWERTTRIFEMHTFGPRDSGKWAEIAKFHGVSEMSNRDKMKSGNGKLHIERLNEAALGGRRIIMQQPHPAIANSEAYPIERVIQLTGMDWFMGSPCYMLALAICEGYTNIRVYGLDQLDWEHTLQRECYVYWMGYAIGKGVEVSGALTWLNGIDKRYGYDYGPEWDAWQKKILWRGHPFELDYKIKSRIVEGDLYKPGGK